MSPEIIISALTRLMDLLEKRFLEQKRKHKKFKQLQMMLIVLSFSISLVLFVVYKTSIMQMLFVLFAFNFLFYIGFKPRSFYSEKKVEKMKQDILYLLENLKKFLMEEEVSFNGISCRASDGWACDKWGLYKEDKRIDYGEFLYDKHIKGLYIEALRNKK